MSSWWRVNTLLLLLLVLCCPCKFIQGPMYFGPLTFLRSTTTAAEDFGRIHFNLPSAVLRPQTPGDIQALMTFFSSSSASHFTKVSVAARGEGHSIHGQAQALHGIVVEMNSLPSAIKIHSDGFSSYADVGGGALWAELLEETLKLGLSPRSWTDYLYLSIGGTLSNAGISGQTFKYGPQISNVLQLDVVTGKGELVTCSPSKDSELFYAVLGGLGQFGIITSARILLQDAPHKVRWARAFYNDFQQFLKDQELLVSMADMVDYVEGFIVLNENSLLSSSISFPANLDPMMELMKRNPQPQVLYCIEFAIYEGGERDLEEVWNAVSGELSYMPSQVYRADVSYMDFLNRVRTEEVSLREKGLWEVPHPWLNMFVPRSGIEGFKDLLMASISPQEFEGPILIYPLVKDKWDGNTSAVLPETNDRLVFIVGVLQSATRAGPCLEELLLRNRRVANAASSPAIGAKQYLAHHTSHGQWRDHFGRKWDRFAARKAQFDPHAILSPGHAIFPRSLLRRRSSS